MNRAEHLKQHEDRASKRERTGEATAALHGGDDAHRDRELSAGEPPTEWRRGRGPPSPGTAEELPFLALGEGLERDRVLPQKRRAHGLGGPRAAGQLQMRSEEHTSELQ